MSRGGARSSLAGRRTTMPRAPWAPSCGCWTRRSRSTPRARERVHAQDGRRRPHRRERARRAGQRGGALRSGGAVEFRYRGLDGKPRPTWLAHGPGASLREPLPRARGHDAGGGVWRRRGHGSLGRGSEELAPALGTDLALDELAGVRGLEVQALVALKGALRLVLVLDDLLGRLLLGPRARRSKSHGRDGHGAPQHTAASGSADVRVAHWQVTSVSSVPPRTTPRRSARF